MSTKSPYQATTQLGSKNITLSAETADDLLTQTEELIRISDSLLENLTTLDQIILAKSVISAPAPATATHPLSVFTAQPTPGLSAPPPGVGAPAGAPMCAHGQRVTRSGTKADGGTWSAHFCPSPKGTPDQCKPIDGVTGKPWRS